MLPSFTGFGRLVSRIMLPMVAVLAVIMVPSYLASNANEYYYGAGHMFAADTEVGRDTEAIEAVFGQSDTYVLLVPAGDTATQSELSAALHALPQVTGIISYVDTAGSEIPPGFLDDATLAQLVSGDSGVPGAAGAGAQPDPAHRPGFVHRDGHLVQPGPALLHRHGGLLHRLPHHQLGPAGGYGGLRHPLFGPLPGRTKSRPSWPRWPPSPHRS